MGKFFYITKKQIPVNQTTIRSRPRAFVLNTFFPLTKASYYLEHKLHSLYFVVKRGRKMSNQELCPNIIFQNIHTVLYIYHLLLFIKRMVDEMLYIWCIISEVSGVI